MADRTFYPSLCYGFARVYAEFQFSTNGASAPVLTSVDGADIVASLAHTGGTNSITVTLKDKFNKCIASSASIRESTGNYAEVSAVANEGSSTLPIAITVHYFLANGSVRNDPAAVLTTIQLAFRNSAGGGTLK